MLDSLDLVLIALAGLLIINAYLIAKLRRMSFQLYDMSSVINRMALHEFLQVTRQPEILQLLKFELELDHPLPATRGWAASPDFLLIIARHAAAAQPNIIVECGSGTSTVVLARCCQRNGRGHVYSLDHDGEFAQQTRDQLARHGLQAFATVIHAPLAPSKLGEQVWQWYSADKIPQLASIDMVVVDGPPMPSGRLIRYPAGPFLVRHLSAGGKAFLDDADRPDEKEMAAMWVREFPGLSQRSLFAEKGCIELTRAN